jgi:hypothetical protein
LPVNQKGLIVQMPYEVTDDGGYRVERVRKCWQPVPYRLYSLFDMARLFLNEYFDVVRTLVSWYTFQHRGATGLFGRNESGEDMVEKLRDIGTSLMRIGLTVAAERAKMGVETMGHDFATWDMFRQTCAEIYNVAQCESRSKLFLYVPADRAEFYETPQAFGAEVFQSFPSANDDIAEACTCLALDRGTACVMHLSRVAEVGLRALAAEMKIPTQNDWGRYLAEINDELAKRYKTSGARSADEQFYAEAALIFDQMRRAWRNPSMHVDRSYSSERAKEILESVRSFMKHLATRIRC